MRGRSLYGPGFGFGPGRGRMANLGMGNPYPFCRFNPELPSRRAMLYGVRDTAADSRMEVEYLKAAAEELKDQLDRVKTRLDEIEGREE